MDRQTQRDTIMRYVDKMLDEGEAAVPNPTRIEVHLCICPVRVRGNDSLKFVNSQTIDLELS